MEASESDARLSVSDRGELSMASDSSVSFNFLVCGSSEFGAAERLLLRIEGNGESLWLGRPRDGCILRRKFEVARGCCMGEDSRWIGSRKHNKKSAGFMSCTCIKGLLQRLHTKEPKGVTFVCKSVTNKGIL